jgi:HTH-type transcriptional regulator, competence development regulator
MKDKDDASSITHALHDILLEAEPSELRAVISEANMDADDLVRQGRAAIARALNPSEATAVAPNEHEGLRLLLQLLRRRAGLTEEQLGEAARIEVAEVRRIEYDAAYTPMPRTVYQLEQYFRLPKRSLAKLAGMTRQPSAQFQDEVLRFAASAKAIGKLTSDEKKVLNAFVNFLGANADAEGE